jgi:hypothetical protein
MTESEAGKSEDEVRGQFAALGLFIESFENIVSLLRGECSRILRGEQLGIPSVPRGILVFHWNICVLAFHHQAMTAQPIVDIWQAFMFELTQAMVSLTTISPRGSEIANEIVGDIANEFRDMIATRNHMIHGTWRISRPLLTDNLLHKELVAKYKVTKTGLEKRDDLPQSFDEIMDLARRNERLMGMLGRFLQYFIYMPKKIEETFAKVGGTWVISLGTKIERWTPTPRASR